MKLSGWTIILLGLCLGLSVLSYALFQVYLPNEQAVQNNNDVRALLDAEAAKQNSANKRVEKAVEKVNEAANRWNQITATKTPPQALPRGIDLYKNPYQLVVDSRKYRNSAQRAFNTQLRKGHVKIVSAPEIPQPTDSETEIVSDYYNYPALGSPVVVWELGSVTVSGTYAQITQNVREWRNMPNYLAVASGLQISGTSPNLTGTYNVTLVGFLKSPKLYPPAGIIMSTGSGAGNGAPAGNAPGRPNGAGQKPAPGSARP